MNVLDIHSGPMKLESPGYSRPMKLKSPVYLRISGIFRPGPTKHKSCVYLRISGILRPGPTKHKSFVYLLTFVAYEVQISGIFGASDAQTTYVHLRIWGIFRARITCIFANHLDICKSHKYSGPKGARISSIFSNILIFLYHLEILNLLDNLESPGYWGSMKCKSTGYSGPMKCESYGYLQISWTFGGLRGVNLLDICESHEYSGPMKRKSPEYLWPMKHDLLDIWDLWRANLMDICKSPGHSWISWIFGAYEARISWIFGAYEERLSRIFAKLLDIHGLWSAGCAGPV